MIISRYLFREILYTLLALTALLLLIYVSHRFMAYLVQASAGKLPAEFIFHLLGLKLLSDLMLILPLGFFLAILLALGRLHKDNEITALAACGQPVPLGSILLLSTFFAGIIALLSLVLSPWAYNQKGMLQIRLRNMAEIGVITAGRFKEFNRGQGIFYTQSIDTKEHIMHTLFMQVNLAHKQVILVAERGYQIEQDDDLFLVLTQGKRYEKIPGQLDYTITTFAEHHIKLPKRFDTPQESNLATLPTHRIWHEATSIAQAELQWRLSLPLTVILLALLAVPLSHTTPRQGQYAKIFAGILIYLIYNNSLNIAKKWLERGDVPAWIGLWWVHLALLGIILILFYIPIIKNSWLSRRRYRGES